MHNAVYCFFFFQMGHGYSKRAFESCMASRDEHIGLYWDVGAIQVGKPQKGQDTEWLERDEYAVPKHDEIDTL